MNQSSINDKVESKETCSSFLPEGDLSALISAALVDQALCELLLTNPCATFEFTYGTESFKLTPDERELLLSVKNPASLADLAQQITENYVNAQHNN